MKRASGVFLPTSQPCTLGLDLSMESVLLIGPAVQQCRTADVAIFTVLGFTGERLGWI